MREALAVYPQANVKQVKGELMLIASSSPIPFNEIECSEEIFLSLRFRRFRVTLRIRS